MQMPDIPSGFSPFEPSSPYLDLIGPLYMRRGEGDFVLGLRIEERHCNRRGLAHGGLLVTLADLQLGYSNVLSADPPRPLVTVNLTTDFLGSATQGDWVEAHSEFQRLGRSMAFGNCYLTVGDRRIARASGIFRATDEGAS